jgi:hypothetical protein
MNKNTWEAQDMKLMRSGKSTETIVERTRNFFGQGKEELKLYEI